MKHCYRLTDLQTYRPNYLCVLLICLSEVSTVLYRLPCPLCGWSFHALGKHTLLFSFLCFHLEERVLWEHVCSALNLPPGCKERMPKLMHIVFMYALSKHCVTTQAVSDLLSIIFFFWIFLTLRFWYHLPAFIEEIYSGLNLELLTSYIPK